MKQLLVFLSFLLLYANCRSAKPEIDYREEMRTFVMDIASYAREQDPDFIVIPQNGHELLLKDDELASDYIAAINGLGQEDLFFGYIGDNVSTPIDDQEYLINNLTIGKENNKQILVTDYAWSESNTLESIEKNRSKGYISFAAPSRNLEVIPDLAIQNESSTDIYSLSEAQNFLYLLNYEEFDTKLELLDAISATNYDVLIIDAFWDDNMLIYNDLERLKRKANGGRRLVISYMSIGEAGDFRFYWKENWKPGEPEWVEEENPNWEGNYKVRYWENEWQKLIFGNKESYTQKIIDSGFDGVYLDIIDAFWYFEN